MHWLLLIVLGIIVLILFQTQNYEHMGTGALIQLYAKGPQDAYLTTDTEKYYNPFYYPYAYPYAYQYTNLYTNPYNWIWNMSTRTTYPYYYY